MNSKERVLTTLGHQEADRVPIHAVCVPRLQRRLEEEYRLAADDLYIHLGNDILTVSFGMATGFYKEDCPTYVDDFGITWKNVGPYTEIVEHPLDTEEKVWHYTPPPIDEDEIARKAKRTLEKYAKDYAIAGKISQTVFESAFSLRGMERFLMDLVVNEEMADHLLDNMMHYHLGIGRILVRLGVDIIYTGDDVGGQHGMLISPNMFRKYLKPKYAYMWNEFKRINGNVKIAHHTCGNVMAVVPDYIEAGLDILQSVQPTAINISELKKRFGRSLLFWGGIDIQQTLPFGSREDIFNEVKERIRVLGPGGGFIISPSNNLQDDTSLENVRSFYEAAKTFGIYPLKF